MKVQLKKLLVGGVLSAFLMSGCAKDKNADEEHQQKVQLLLGQVKAAAGDYRGTITQTDGTLSNIDIGFDGTEVAVNSSDNTGALSQVAIQGHITINNDTAIIQSANYDPNYQSFTGTISIPIAATDTTPAITANLNISGTIVNGVFTGQISILNQPGIAGNFTAVKGAPVGTSVTTISSVPASGLSFSGPLLDQPTTKVVMIVKENLSNSNERFLNNFTLQKKVDVALNFNTSSGGTVYISFASAQWDKSGHYLHAEGKSSSSNQNNVDLNCSSEEADQNLTWHCTYESNYNGMSHSFDLTGGSK